MGTLKRRLIDISFELGGTQTFDSSEGSNKVSLTGHRVSVKVIKAGAKAASTAQISVYGMALSQMNKLTTQGMSPLPPNVPRNKVTIKAGDEDTSLGIVFIGTIVQAWGDFNSSPDVSFRVECQAAYFSAVDKAEPASYPDGVDVATAMSSVAAQMGLNLENSGVNLKLPTSYYYGSPKSQMDAIARDANIEAKVDLDKLAIWPKGQSRNSQIVKLSKDTGMIGYPSWTNQGIQVRCLFNPSIAFGGAIDLKNEILTAANGEWIVYSLDHNLDSLVPNGQWFTTLLAARRGKVPTSSGVLPVAQ